MQQASCKTCRYSFTDPALPAPATHCRRYPPVALVVQIEHPMTRQISQTFAATFPIVSPAAWCGEFQASGLHLDS